MDVHVTLRIAGCNLLGPLDENEAITGAGFLPNNVLAGDILMVAPVLKGSSLRNVVCARMKNGALVSCFVYIEKHECIEPTRIRY